MKISSHIPEIGDLVDKYAYAPFNTIQDSALTLELGRKVSFLPYKKGWAYYVEGCPHRFILTMTGMFRQPNLTASMAKAFKRHLVTCSDL